MRFSKRMVPFVAVVAMLALVPAPAIGKGGGHAPKKGGGTPVTVVGGIQGPVFGLGTAPSGDILVADASTGVLSFSPSKSGKRSKGGATSVAASVPGASDVSAIGSRSFWVSTGAGADPQADTGQGLFRASKRSSRKVANLFSFEATVNPDGNDPPDSNPYAVASLGGGAALVVDAGGNDLLRVDRRGRIKTLATFPDSLVSTDNLKSLAGCPSPAPFCDLPPMIPAESVPTSVAIGPDGHYYVGELRGFPAPAGESRIWRVSPKASGAECGTTPACTLVFDGGFTSIIDLAFGPGGKLYVAELDENSWAALEITGDPAGGTINACKIATLSCTEVATDVPMLTALTFGRDGSLWAVRNALIPGGVEVFKV